MEAFEHFGKNWSFILSVIVSIVPVLSLIGHIFTSDGRRSFKETPTVILYFIIMGAYAYCYWFDREIIRTFLGLSSIWQFAVYVVLCLGIIIEKKIPQ